MSCKTKSRVLRRKVIVRGINTDGQQQPRGPGPGRSGPRAWSSEVACRWHLARIDDDVVGVAVRRSHRRRFSGQVLLVWEICHGDRTGLGTGATAGRHSWRLYTCQILFTLRRVSVCGMLHACITVSLIVASPWNRTIYELTLLTARPGVPGVQVSAPCHCLC